MWKVITLMSKRVIMYYSKGNKKKFQNFSWGENHNVHNHNEIMSVFKHLLLTQRNYRSLGSKKEHKHS